MFRSFTYQTDYRVKGDKFFGAVNIINGTHISDNPVIIRIARDSKEEALEDASRQARKMVAFGAKAPVDLNEFDGVLVCLMGDKS